MAQPIAQTSPSAAKALVTAVTVSDVSPTETRLLVIFNQPAPPISIIANNGETAIVAFTGSALAPTVVAPAGRHGALLAMAFAQSDSILTLTLRGAGPLRVTTMPLSGSVVAVSVVGAAEIRPPEAPLPAAPHVDLQPGSVFEVVPLIYADVSEIVGLLTTGPGVKPNDSFSPQEPAFGSAGMSGAYGGGGIPTSALTGVGGFTGAGA
ncbi:MAG TPA: hypothetical protein VGI30_08275, partial [Caulobacteraceae bacterium]